MDIRVSACLAAHLPRPIFVECVADVDGIVSQTRRRRLLCNNELNDVPARSLTGTSKEGIKRDSVNAIVLGITPTTYLRYHLIGLYYTECLPSTSTLHITQNRRLGARWRKEQ